MHDRTGRRPHMYTHLANNRPSGTRCGTRPFFPPHQSFSMATVRANNHPDHPPPCVLQCTIAPAAVHPCIHISQITVRPARGASPAHFPPHQSWWMRPSRCISLLLASRRARASSTLALCLACTRALCRCMHSKSASNVHSSRPPAAWVKQRGRLGRSTRRAASRHRRGPPHDPAVDHAHCAVDPGCKNVVAFKRTPASAEAATGKNVSILPRLEQPWQNPSLSSTPPCQSNPAV